jgi:hypothetical protein
MTEAIQGPWIATSQAPRNDKSRVIARNEAIQGPWIATAFGLAMTPLSSLRGAQRRGNLNDAHKTQPAVIICWSISAWAVLLCQTA